MDVAKQGKYFCITSYFKNFSRYNQSPTLEIIPQTQRLQKISLEWEHWFWHPLSFALSSIDNLPCNQVNLEIEYLRFDSDLEGMDSFPNEFLAGLTPCANNWEQKKSNFRMINATIPAFASLSFVNDRLEVVQMYPEEKYVFTFEDKR